MRLPTREEMARTRPLRVAILLGRLPLPGEHDAELSDLDALEHPDEGSGVMLEDLGVAGGPGHDMSSDPDIMTRAELIETLVEYGWHREVIEGESTYGLRLLIEDGPLT